MHHKAGLIEEGVRRGNRAENQCDRQTEGHEKRFGSSNSYQRSSTCKTSRGNRSRDAATAIFATTTRSPQFGSCTSEPARSQRNGVAFYRL
jgi:hypothetical protein